MYRPPTHTQQVSWCAACAAFSWPGEVDVGDTPSPLLLIAVVLHLHCHLDCEVILQRILATVGVVPVQAEGAPVLPACIESAMRKGK